MPARREPLSRCGAAALPTNKLRLGINTSIEMVGWSGEREVRHSGHSGRATQPSPVYTIRAARARRHGDRKRAAHLRYASQQMRPKRPGRSDPRDAHGSGVSIVREVAVVAALAKCELSLRLRAKRRLRSAERWSAPQPGKEVSGHLPGVFAGAAVLRARNLPKLAETCAVASYADLTSIRLACACSVLGK